MHRRRIRRYGLARLAVLAVLLGLVACSGNSLQSSTNQSADLAELQQQVDAQATNIAALEDQGTLAEQVSAQARRVAMLETQVALLPSAAKPMSTATLVPTLVPEMPQAVPTLAPAVAGMATEGTTKGAAGAPVIITEYVDYL
jgi:negative regulator of sigma E activity